MSAAFSETDDEKDRNSECVRMDDEEDSLDGSSKVSAVSSAPNSPSYEPPDSNRIQTGSSTPTEPNNGNQLSHASDGSKTKSDGKAKIKKEGGKSSHKKHRRNRTTFTTYQLVGSDFNAQRKTLLFNIVSQLEDINIRFHSTNWNAPSINLIILTFTHAKSLPAA